MVRCTSYGLQRPRCKCSFCKGPPRLNVVCAAEVEHDLSEGPISVQLTEENPGLKGRGAVFQDSQQACHISILDFPAILASIGTDDVTPAVWCVDIEKMKNCWLQAALLRIDTVSMPIRGILVMEVIRMEADGHNFCADNTLSHVLGLMLQPPSEKTVGLEDIM